MVLVFANLRHTLRQLRRSPGFSLAVVAILALGIGLNAAIFTVVDCVLLRPLGYHDADRIVSLRTHFVNEHRSIPRVGGDDYRDLATQVPGLEAAAYYQGYPDGLALHGQAIYLPIAHVSPRFGEVLGVQSIAGRLFAATDNKGTDALVSAEFARDHFGSAQAALGQLLQWTGAPRTIAFTPQSGRASRQPTGASLWTMPRSGLALKPYESPDAAELDRAGICRSKATTMRENIGQTEQGERFRTILFASFAGVSLLLASLGVYGVTAYAVSQRSFEFGLRIAVGASRAQVLSLVMCSALSVAVLGILLGAGLSFALARLLSAGWGALPAFDLLACALAAGAVLLIAAVASLVPAWAAATTDPVHVLRAH